MADQENMSAILSSPPRSITGQKLRKPPTVTPKRFTKFFTPRSSLSGKGTRQSKAGRQLRDITINGSNRRRGEQIIAGLEGDFPSPRPFKRRKQSFDLTSSPPQSSPLKHVQISPAKQIHIYEDDAHSTGIQEEEEEAELPEFCDHPSPRLPIRRIQSKSTAHRLLARSFGGHDTRTRGRRGPDHCVPSVSAIANFYTSPSDVHSFRGAGKSLPFCTSSCNTNALFAIGDEDGRVHMIDTSPSANFGQCHVKFQVHHNALIDMAFSPCDYILATASGDRTARVVDMHTQRTLCILAAHQASLKQIRFHPGDDKLLTTSGRDGMVNIWDLRCSRISVQSLRIGHQAASDEKPANLYPYATMSAGPAHRVASAREKIVKSDPYDDPSLPAGVSITSIEHLHGSRSHLLMTASEQNASLKLFDLRAAGRNSKNERMGFEVPVSCTAVPERHAQTRNYGVSALALSGDGARAYSVCRDSAVYVYSTNHLIMGSAPEMVDLAKRTRVTPPDKPKSGLGPLYALRHPSLRVSSFYIKTSLRKASVDGEELLAVGSQDECAVLFPTDERNLNFRPEIEHSTYSSGYDAEGDLPRCPLPTKRDSRTSSLKTFNGTGAALTRGHSREVTSLAFAHGGELVTVSDDFKARCWREDANKARSLRQHGESGGARWSSGWADVPSAWDEDDE